MVVAAPVESAEAPKQEHKVVFMLNFFDELPRSVPTVAQRGDSGGRRVLARCMQTSQRLQHRHSDDLCQLCQIVTARTGIGYSHEALRAS